MFVETVGSEVCDQYINKVKNEVELEEDVCRKEARVCRGHIKQNDSLCSSFSRQSPPTVCIKFNQRCRPLVDEQDYGCTASFCHAQQTDKGNNNVVCYSRLLSAEFNLSPLELH